MPMFRIRGSRGLGVVQRALALLGMLPIRHASAVSVDRQRLAIRLKLFPVVGAAMTVAYSPGRLSNRREACVA